MNAHIQLPYNPVVSLSSLSGILILALLIYFFAVVKQYRHGRQWNMLRSIWFVTGVLLLVVALSSRLEQLAHEHFTAHMAQHLLIGMFAPIAFVLSMPVTLLLRSLPVNTASKIASVFQSRWCYWLVRPPVALLLNIGGMYLLYLTPLYALSLENLTIHYLVHWHFFAAGYLFVWSLIGPDPLPEPSSFESKVFILLVSIAAHSILAKLMYGQLIPSDAGYPALEIQAGAKLMYYGGDLAEIIIAVILFSKIFPHRSKKESMNKREQ